jgi:hypothetical protein
MIRRLALLMAGLFFCATLVMADEEKTAEKKKDPTKPVKATIEATSLSVSKKLDEKNWQWPMFSQTSLQLMVSVPDKQLLGVDASSSVSEFKDDKKNSLLSTNAFFKTNFNTYATISKDRKALLVNVGSNVTPGKGASRITLKGNLVVRCGLDEKSTKAKDVEIKDKAEEKIGDFTLTVTQAKGFGTWGGSFNIKADKPTIKSITFKDADDKDVEVAGGVPYNFGNVWTYSFTLKKQVEKGKITITYFSKEEKVTIPVEVSIGAGL